MGNKTKMVFTVVFVYFLIEFIKRNFIIPRRIQQAKTRGDIKRMGVEFPGPFNGYWLPIVGHTFFALMHRDIKALDEMLKEMNQIHRETVKQIGQERSLEDLKRHELDDDFDDNDGYGKNEVVPKDMDSLPAVQIAGVKLELFNQSLVVLTTPEDIKYVTQTNFKNYVVGELRQEVVIPFLGVGIFTTDDAFWKEQRNLAKPSFQNLKLEQMLPIFKNHAEFFLEILGHTPKHQSVEVQNLFMCYTLDCSGDILFNHPIGSLHGNIPFQKAFDYLQLETEKRITDPSWKIIPNRKYTECTKICDEFVHEIIKKARNDPSLHERNDLLAQFMTSTDENGKEKMHDDKYLRDMLMNFLIAGRDTTATTLTWLFYELAQNPRVQNKVYHEIEKLFPGKNLPQNLNEMRELKYLKDTINEALRLHPPVPRVLRCARGDDVLPSGFTIKAKTNVIYQPYFLHRTENLWGPDVLVFDPDRWSDDRTKKIGSFEFLPFHGGPRRCLGFDLAYNEVKTLTLMILKNYEVTLDHTHPVEHLGAITLAAKNGVKIFFSPRNASD